MGGLHARVCPFSPQADNLVDLATDTLTQLLSSPRYPILMVTKESFVTGDIQSNSLQSVQTSLRYAHAIAFTKRMSPCTPSMVKLSSKHALLLCVSHSCGISLQVAYLLLYGELPSAKELARFEEAVGRHSAVPAAVEDAINALPHDAHFMGSILVGINALSTCHPEQNPALAGQDVYHSKEIQDKQIVRLIGT